MQENNSYWFYEPVKKLDGDALKKAEDHQASLTKPPGSLGELENIAIKFAAWQGRVKPELDRIGICVFAADHGICAKGISAFPQAVTVQMVANFVAGGAAISVLAKALNADFSVVNMGVAHPLLTDNGVINAVIAAGTADFSEQAAMSSEQCLQALNAGKKQVMDADWQLFIGGEMGIGNTTSATALYCALLGISPSEAAGPGTGISSQGVTLKAQLINHALERHVNEETTAWQVLQTMGGFEIAALVGAYIACAQQGIPVLVDGFICTAAALIAIKLNPDVQKWMLFAHKSAEPAHSRALDYLNVRPLLDLSMRLGEGSGAAVALPIVKSALQLHNHMATFTQANVSNGS